MTPRQLFVETSNICNADCVFCAYRFDERPKKIMGMDDFARIVREYRALGGDIVNFTPYAGEVFSDAAFLDKVRLTRDLGFREINTYTNATLLHKFGAEAILTSGLTSLAISTAPLDPEIYEKIFRSRLYKRMLDNTADLIARFHETPDTSLREIRIEFRADRPLDAILAMPDYARWRPYVGGAVKLTCMTAFDSWMGAITPDDLLPGMTLRPAGEIKTVPCDRLYMLKVTSDGNMRACGCRYDYSSDTDNFHIGHVSEMSLAEADASAKLDAIKASFREGRPPAECVKCAWYETHRYGGA